MIVELPRKSALQVLEVLPTAGSSPLRVLTDDLEVYLVKPYQGRRPAYSLINELICHYLLRIWGIPTPDAALVWVDPDLLPDPLPAPHKAHRFRKPCFGSRFPTGGAWEMNPLISFRTANDLKRFSNPADLLKLGLFDIWVSNASRTRTHPNLMAAFIGEQWKFLAIDHSRAFGEQAYSKLDPKAPLEIPFNRSILGSNVAGQIKTYFANQRIPVFSREYFHSLIRRCETQLESFVNQIPEDMGFTAKVREPLLDYLFTTKRNEAVYDDFLQKLR